MRKYVLAAVCLVCALFFFSSVSFSAEDKPLKGEKFFTRTNLKNKGRLIFFYNMSKVAGIIPAGTAVEIRGSSAKIIKFKKEDSKKTYKITDRPTVYRKYFVSDKDEIGFGIMSDKAKAAIKLMQVYEGMTKNEVLVSKGCPAYIAVGVKSWGKTLEQIMASNSWYYNVDSRRREMIISFENGIVSTIARR
ncbi:MAG: hypothetical protein ISS33_04635 [Candidatus Omnitrophica bacterium]|nr:hypothetical protein [Candidatus Omnitrophota bacterium]